MNTMMDKIIPCIWITPIDCYWEGAKPLGPYPPLNLGWAVHPSSYNFILFREEVAAFVSSLPKGNVTWKNLNPTAVMSEVGNLFDLGPIGNFFERVGSRFSKGYSPDPGQQCPIFGGIGPID